jgi:hypothetical protein
MMNGKLQTPYGIFSGVTSAEYAHDGRLLGLRLEEQNVILTHAGELIPFYGDDSPRRKYKASVTFHPNGMIRAVSLEDQQEVDTPVGELPAELVTFYDTGELKRVFPLDGKISGFWSEEDERGLNIPLSFEFDFASFTAMLSGLCFYKSGAVQSVTLFPKEIITISHERLGPIAVRHGFSLYENGALRSLEPAGPLKLQTPIGIVAAYDCTANGINADMNSLCFDEQGNIRSLVTSSDQIRVYPAGGASRAYTPKVLSDEDETVEVIPLNIGFHHDTRTVTIISPDGTTDNFDFDDTFVITNGGVKSPTCSEGDCASCRLCANKS